VGVLAGLRESVLAGGGPVTPELSVVVPVRNGGSTLESCLHALASQSLPRERFEIIVVDDGSTDGSVGVATPLATRVISRAPGGAGAARNTGWEAARGRWVAFTDADCVPSRSWLATFTAEIERGGGELLGAAGRTVGYDSESSAARFVDLVGGLDGERHLDHPTFPFAPSCNVMYRRDALAEVGGFDERFSSYEACDLHTRLVATQPGPFVFAPRAVVLHRHRPSWAGYWRQQYSYGRGYAQFVWRYRDRLPWSVTEEARAWASVLRAAGAALVVHDGDEALVRRGLVVKLLAQRLGFDATFWGRAERARW
jgi:glycosyltransferase involved in cell wall biosynthesis